MDSLALTLLLLAICGCWLQWRARRDLHGARAELAAMPELSDAALRDSLLEAERTYLRARRGRVALVGVCLTGAAIVQFLL